MEAHTVMPDGPSGRIALLRGLSLLLAFLDAFPIRISLSLVKIHVKTRKNAFNFADCRRLRDFN
jgi:hypothetical protein